MRKRVAICREEDGFDTIPCRAHRGSMRRGGGLVAKSWTPWSVACQAPLYPWDFPGRNTGVG